MKRFAFWGLLGALILGAAGCRKETPPSDRQITEGYRLLLPSPKKALEHFRKAKNPSDPVALLGQSLAYERLGEYSKAEAILLRIPNVADRPEPGLALVRVRVMLGKHEEARKGIDRVVKKAPTNLSVLLVESCLANDESRARATLKHLDAWASKGPAAKAVPAEYHLARAALLSKLREPEKARAAKEAAAKGKLSHNSVGALLAGVASSAGQRTLAVLVLEHMVEHTSNPEVLKQVARLSHALKAHSVTEVALRQLLGETPDVLKLRALHEAATGKPTAAIRLREALAATKDAKETLQLGLLLADALLRQENPEDARAELERLDKRHPKNLDVILRLARVDLAEKKAEAAIGRLEPHAVKEAKPAVRELLASAYAMAGQTAKAEEQYEAVLSQLPTHQASLSSLAALKMSAGDNEAAIERVKKQVELAPKDAGLRLLYALVLRKAGQTEQSEAALRQAVEAMPDEPRLWSALARSQQVRKANDESLKTLKEAERKNPQSLAIAAELAALLTRRGEGKAALPYYQRILRFASEDPIVLNNTAMLYADVVGDAAKAVELAERAHRLSPFRPEVVDTLAWALYKRGGKKDIERARTLLESVQERNATATGKYHLGLVLLASGVEGRGKELLREALAMPGEFPEAEAARQALGAGSAVGQPSP